MASRESREEAGVLPGGLHNLVTGLTPHSSSSPSGSSTALPESTLDSTGAPPSQTLFNTSDFSFGPPVTSRSVSSNSGPGAPSGFTAFSKSSRSVAALAIETTKSNEFCSQHNDIPSDLNGSRTNNRIEKEVDDLNIPAGRNSTGEVGRCSTPNRLTRLLAATSSATSSRQSSYNMIPGENPYIRASVDETPLPNHLYTKGFLYGRHSDITVHAFNTSYALHRLLLDRAPFFSSALSEPWFESSAKEITLHPEEIDSNITQNAFELALKRLYGSLASPSVSTEEDEEAIGLFATGCWLEMGEIINSSVDSILRQMCPANLSDLIRVVSNNYYGAPGERLLSSAKAMLFREGWEMPIKFWDGISGDLVRDLVGGDGFYVEDEWERWLFARKLLNRRLKALAKHSHSLDSNKGKNAAQSPHSQDLRNDDHDQRQERSNGSVPASDQHDSWHHLYDHPDVAPIVRLLDGGIHYAHLTFEQLQHIQSQRDVLGNLVTPLETVTRALWMSMELRQSVVNAPETALELGLKHVNESVPPDDAEGMKRTVSGDSDRTNTSSTGWVEVDATGPQLDFDAWDTQDGPRKFWIPDADSTSVIGDTSEDRGPTTLHRIPPKCQPKGQLPPESGLCSRYVHSPNRTPTTEIARKAGEKPHLSFPSPSNCASLPKFYSYLPPYRFSVSFPSSRLLKEKKRVYSRSVWYAGSMWNIYVQKVRSSKNIQLGVYLHRAKDREGDDTVGAINGAATVDERIGQLEREMLLHRSERRAKRRQQYEAQLEIEDDSSSGGDNNAMQRSTVGSPRSTGVGGLLPRNSKPLQTAPLVLSDIPYQAYNDAADEGSASDTEDEDDEKGTAAERLAQIPALPQYTDTRPTIKTYFKIFSPSKGGRMLSVYESAPDGFNFSQSWGWKSTTLILDDGIDGSGHNRDKDGRLRFSVVLGNV
ncbi:MAG: hypothetical protein M1837_005087 [Sclerophora amabilis]|nr:MAG: hypothetical protein M1837_005087 [Sclerophora amabilis]